MLYDFTDFDYALRLSLDRAYIESIFQLAF